MSAGVADVQARIAEIKSRFGVTEPAPPSVPSGNDFASALAGASASLDGSGLGTGTGTGSSTTTGAQVVNDSLKYLGVPYLWGGTDPAVGLDCSGLVQRVYRDMGIELPRVSQDQATAGAAVADMASAQPGDLLVFGDDRGHIGIYAGSGRMVVAPHTGSKVEIETVTDTPVAIRRILGAVPPSVGASSAARSSSPYDSLFQSAGQRNGVSPAVLAAVARAESGMNPNAVSKAGAVGLMQLMPGTAQGLGVDPADPAQAVDGAARLLSQNMQRFGSLDLALAAYNAGPNAVAKAGGIPAYKETQGYVQRILDDLSRTSAGPTSSRTERL